MDKTKTKMIAILCLVLLVMATGYAYFATNLNITTTGNVTGKWDIKFTNVSEGDPNGTQATNGAAPKFTDNTVTLVTDLKVPTDEMTYDLTISNLGNFGGIIDKIEANATGSPAIIFSISGVKEGDKIAAGETKIMQVKLEYDSTISSQPKETSKTLKVTIHVVQDTGQDITPVTPDIDQPLMAQLGNKILTDNIAYSDKVASPFVTSSSGIDFTKVSSNTNGKGLYYTTTNTEDGKVTYYFRGDVQNNYVKFGKDKDENDLYWRIVRINEDGSVRVIYQGTSATATRYDTTIGTSEYNMDDSCSDNSKKCNDDNAYVGYMYGLMGLTAELSSPVCVTYDSTNKKAVNSTTTYTTKSSCENAGGVWATNAQEATHANVVDSRIKKTIDKWYNENLSSYGNYLADAGFCNNRKTRTTSNGYGTLTTTYAAAYRLPSSKGGNPQFVCPQTNDLFTTSTSNKGNKSLTNPIATITADEMVYAGGVADVANANYYLYPGSSTMYWTMTPIEFDESKKFNGEENNGGSFVYGFASGGALDDLYRVYNHVVNSVRPVINLKSNLLVESGNGTKDNPYVIK